MDLATDANDTVHMRQQCLGRCVAIACTQHDEPDRLTRGTERLRDRGRRDDPGPTISRLEQQAVLVSAAAEVNNRWLELTQLAQQIQGATAPRVTNSNRSR
jgi:hypothetical protein